MSVLKYLVLWEKIVNLRFSRTPPFIRPFADFGTLFYMRILLLPFWPFTRFTQSEIAECHPMTFTSQRDLNRKIKQGKVRVGAVWDEHWNNEYQKGLDGKTLVVMTPHGPWHLDDISSNCTRKDDPDHRCWIRHGSAEEGNLQVDKKGNTCESGAGSVRFINIKTGETYYHGRLMRNKLVRIGFF